MQHMHHLCAASSLGPTAMSQCHRLFVPSPYGNITSSLSPRLHELSDCTLLHGMQFRGHAKRVLVWGSTADGNVALTRTDPGAIRANISMFSATSVVNSHTNAFTL